MILIAALTEAEADRYLTEHNLWDEGVVVFPTNEPNLKGKGRWLTREDRIIICKGAVEGDYYEEIRNAIFATVFFPPNEITTWEPE